MTDGRQLCDLISNRVRVLLLGALRCTDSHNLFLRSLFCICINRVRPVNSKHVFPNGRRASAENPEVARVESARDREGRERPHCLQATLSWNQFWICRSRASLGRLGKNINRLNWRSILSLILNIQAWDWLIGDGLIWRTCWNWFCFHQSEAPRWKRELCSFCLHCHSQWFFWLGQKCWVVSLFERKGRCWEEKRARYYSRNILYVRIWAMQWTNHSISSSFWSVTQSLLRAYKVTIYHVREDPNTFHMTSKSIISIWK